MDSNASKLLLLRFHFGCMKNLCVVMIMFLRSAFVLCTILAMISIDAVGQHNSYFISRTLQKAISKKTRHLNAVPSPNYWQNYANYTIKVQLVPSESLIIGSANIVYFNNSPDSLDRLVFNIYQDVFKKGNSRDWNLGTVDLHDGMNIKRLKWNENEVAVNNSKIISRQGTKLIVKPIKPISANDSVKISVEWEVKIPSQRAGRMGKYNDSTLFVAYWYPQIAVYDDVDGWDMIHFNGSVEFYNDFNNYNVQITVPENFAVWATGILQNADDVFQNEIVKRYTAAWNSDIVQQIIQKKDYKTNSVFKRNAPSTWFFTASGVPDFSFAAGIGMNWDAVSLEVDSQSKRRVLTGAVYHNGAEHQEKVAKFSQMSINYMSKVMPGIPFPYPQMTNFCNGRRNGGMETPMMANNGAPSDAPNTLGLTFHEIAHSYMPFFMGTNEKKYAWMDEGWAALWPHVLVDSIFPEYRYLERTVGGFEESAGNEMDIPPMVPNQLLAANYSSLRLASYVRPAMAYYFLENVLGTGTFTYALQTYMNLWKGLHPLPTDFFRAFELASNQDLYWFFKPWFYDNAYPDLAIRKITTDRKIVIENIGGLPLPVYLEIHFTDGSQQSMILPATVWNKNDKSILIESPADKSIQRVQLGNKLIPDVNRKDNEMLIIDKLIN